MAHDIATIDGQNAIAWQGGTPWHQLGTRIRGGNNIDQAVELARLGYVVELCEMVLADERIMVDGFKATIRRESDGKIVQLGVVGDSYRVVQNSAAIEVLRPLVESFGYTVECAGALGRGERAFMLLRMGDQTIQPVAGDDVRGYLLMYWSHDGSTGIHVMFTPIRVVCQNTLNAAIAGGKAVISIRHTASADANLDQAAAVVRKLGAHMAATGETFAQLAAARVAPEALAAYVDGLIVSDEPSKAPSSIIVGRRETVLKLIHYGKGAAMANQLVDTRDGSASLWAAYNAVTEYVDHVRPAEAQSPAGVSRANMSALFGGNAQLKLLALQAARQLVAA
jgi:phage/plasmid-like protein (TIGR03299 family)